MNILTFDIEEWYLEKMYFGDHAEKYKEFDRYLGEILNTLDERNLKGTFFCVGGLGREFPEVVKRIADRGHDVGCHSDIHTWLNKMTREECLADTRMAVDSLEQVIGQKVKSYRAPAFSIGASNKWAFEVLAECGIERDASVFPAVRDFGGFAEFGQKTPAIIRYNGIELPHLYHKADGQRDCLLRWRLLPFLPIVVCKEGDGKCRLLDDVFSYW